MSRLALLALLPLLGCHANNTSPPEQRPVSISFVPDSSMVRMTGRTGDVQVVLFLRVAGARPGDRIEVTFNGRPVGSHDAIGPDEYTHVLEFETKLADDDLGVDLVARIGDVSAFQALPITHADAPVAAPVAPPGG